MAAAVRHPHLTMIHHADVVDGIPYLVMDYIDGPSLAAVIKQSGALPITAALAATLAMTDAVAALHGNGIVHRDIKPKNTLLDRDGHVFVTDFGLALARARPGPSMTPSGVAGTPTYMAPEMFDGLVSPRSDVYALGITTFELITGSPPFSGSLLDVQKQHVGSPLPVAALEDLGVTPASIDVLERATHKNATFRYKSADYYRQALEAATDEAQRAGGRAALKDLAARFVAVETPPKAEQPTSTTPTTTYFHLIGQIADQKRRRAGGEEAGLVSVRPSQTGEPSSAGGDMVQQPVATTEIQRSEETDDPRRILRLRRCPQCDYDLAGLPRRHRCPECGFEYDPSMFALYGWQKHERFSVAGRLLIGAGPERLLGIAVLGFVVYLVIAEVYRTYQSWGTASGNLPIWPFVFLAVIVTKAIEIIARRRGRRAQPGGSGATQLFFSTSGASARRKLGPPGVVRWEEFRKFRFRRVRPDQWLLRLSYPFWQLRWRHDVEAIIECTRREAALVRGEIRRRMRAAQG